MSSHTPDTTTSAENSQAASDIDLVPRPDWPWVVGIGASAGGLGAISALLERLPGDTGCAFVIVQHLKHHQKSMLVPLLQSKTVMPVRATVDHMPVEPNHIYVIVPGSHLTLEGNSLRLQPFRNDQFHEHTIDHFFDSLGRVRGNLAVGILLSGTGNDGVEGLRTIKGEGGITYAQERSSAEFQEMPDNAIRSGCVDFVFPPDQIAAHLVELTRHPLTQDMNWPRDDQVGLNEILYLLRDETGHDFTQYKRSTIRRRVVRRMLMRHIDIEADYLALLKSSRDERDNLVKDFLINITGFFRDPEAFDALKTEVLPQLLAERVGNEPLRIWVAACATGEEAYSIAILLTEYLDEIGSSVPFKLFATDVDVEAIEKARAARYSETALAGVSAERLERFFVPTNGEYTLIKRIRGCCVFSIQNVVQDPPFSRLDLISCRNLLIYLDRALQNRLFTLFHFSLQPWGYLFLGSSESISDGSALFSLVDTKHKIYVKKPGHSRLPKFYASLPIMTRQPSSEYLSDTMNKTRDIQREAEQIVLEEFSPPGVIIDQSMNIIGFVGRTGPFIDPAPGAISLKLLKMAHRDLVAELRSAVMEAINTDLRVEVQAVRYKVGEQEKHVNILVIPMLQGAAKRVQATHLLVLFVGLATAAVETVKPHDPQQVTQLQDRRQRAMEEELNRTKLELRAVISDHVAMNEDLQAANEEIRAANEELQSTNEELVSAQEELQSTNEELATLNDELEARNTELAQANADLVNLLSSVQLPVLILNRELRIRQFTPMAKALLNLIDSDIGRPFSDMKPKIELPDLDQALSTVIRTAQPQTMEVSDQKGRVYSLTIRPYKDLEEVVMGVVLVFFDVTDIKQVKKPELKP